MLLNEKNTTHIYKHKLDEGGLSISASEISIQNSASRSNRSKFKQSGSPPGLESDLAPCALYQMSGLFDTSADAAVATAPFSTQLIAN